MNTNLLPAPGCGKGRLTPELHLVPGSNPADPPGPDAGQRRRAFLMHALGRSIAHLQRQVHAALVDLQRAGDTSSPEVLALLRQAHALGMMRRQLADISPADRGVAA